MKRLDEFKGEEAFKVMGRTVHCLRVIFQDKKAMEIVRGDENGKKKAGWMLEFLEYTLCECSNLWMDLYCTLTPDAKRDKVSTSDVISFASEFMSDEQLMSLFFSQSQMMPKTSTGSVMESTEV